MSAPTEQVENAQALTERTFSDEDLKEVMVASVRLPLVVRDALQAKCVERREKLTTVIKSFLIEEFQLEGDLKALVELDRGEIKRRYGNVDD